MQTLRRNIEFFKVESLQVKKEIKNGYPILRIGDRDYIQGPAFIKQWKEAARSVCESQVSQGIPSFIVESEDYYIIWMSWAHALEDIDPTLQNSKPKPKFPWKKCLGIGLPVFVFAAIVGITLNPSQDGCHLAWNSMRHSGTLSLWETRNLKLLKRVSNENWNNLSIDPNECGTRFQSSV